MNNEKQGCGADAIHASTRLIPLSCESSALQLQRLLRKGRKVHLLVSVLRHVFAGSNTVDRHFGMEFKTAEELGGDEEVLASTAAVFTGSGAGDVDETGVDETRDVLVVVHCARSRVMETRTVRYEGPCLD